MLWRPKFGTTSTKAHLWIDAFVRASRQVFPEQVAYGNAGVIGGDEDDLPILNTAYAVFAASSEYPEVISNAASDGGFYLVSENTKHFEPGRNTFGFQFIRAQDFLELLAGRGSTYP